MTPLKQAASRSSRKGTSAEGGFCTFQPVANGDVCPWKLNCEGGEHFVISGADLLYWRRKREQWALLAERAANIARLAGVPRTFLIGTLMPATSLEMPARTNALAR